MLRVASQYPELSLADALERTGAAGYISYLPRPNAERLPLVQGDADTFGDIIGLLGEYEGMSRKSQVHRVRSADQVSKVFSIDRKASPRTWAPS